MLERAPLSLSIGPGEDSVVRIDPSSLHMAANPGRLGSAVVAGQYRLRFLYGSERLGNVSLEGISETFTISD